jgi:hypothetical protein
MSTFATAVVLSLCGLTAWLCALTAGLARWRRLQGRPVYRRLPDGRTRFDWATHTAFHVARRR